MTSLQQWLKASHPDRAPRLSTLDWRASGTTHRYLILFTGRSGSTLLNSLIRSSGGYGDPREYLNENFVVNAYHPEDRVGSIGDYLAQMASKRTRNGYFGMQIDADRLQRAQDLIDFSGPIFSQRSTKYVQLYREDLVTQAYSFAMARATRVWHRHVDQAPELEGGQRNVSLTAEVIWQELIRLVAHERFLDEFFAAGEITPHIVSYEQLVSSPTTTLGGILDHLGGDPACVPTAVEAAEPGTLPMVYANRDREILRFREEFGDLIATLNQNRGETNLKRIRRRLKKRHGIRVR